MAKKKEELENSQETIETPVEQENEQTPEPVIEYTLYFKHKAPLRGKPFKLIMQGGKVLSDGIGVIDIQQVNN